MRGGGRGVLGEGRGRGEGGRRRLSPSLAAIKADALPSTSPRGQRCGTAREGVDLPEIPSGIKAPP